MDIMKDEKIEYDTDKNDVTKMDLLAVSVRDKTFKYLPEIGDNLITRNEHQHILYKYALE